MQSLSCLLAKPSINVYLHQKIQRDLFALSAVFISLYQETFSFQTIDQEDYYLVILFQLEFKCTIR